ncbi:MAG TPA: LapA family protein [Sedimentisphaerales bacterium]|nr:LapA family protein [Sedimentisphaerales bacterium]
MRYIYMILIVLFTAVVLIFTIQNSASVTLSFLSAKATLSVSVLVILVYLLGMLTGGSVLMFVRSLFKGARKKAQSTGNAKPA